MATLAPPVAGAPLPPPAELQVLAAWAPELADTFVALACDLALVLDDQGRIVHLTQHDERPLAPPHWQGRPWADVVADDSRAKAAQMLHDVITSGHAGRREVNHQGVGGAELPLACSAARLGEDGPVLVVAHDLRALSALQQRFVAAQEALERSYWNAQAQQLDRAGGRKPGLADPALVQALGQLVERFVHEQGPLPANKARRLAERHFLARAIERAGSPDALARALVGGKRPRTRRSRT